MRPSEVDPRVYLPLVDSARFRLTILPWDEVEPGLAMTWAALSEPELPPWQDVSGLIRRWAEDEMVNTRSAEGTGHEGR